MYQSATILHGCVVPKYLSRRKIAGGLSAATPGEVRGYWEAHQRYGKLSWIQLFQPAIRIASEGFRIGTNLAKSIKDSKEYVLSDPGLR